MALYVVRVELHRADASDYGRLHAAMASKGFSRQLLIDGIKFDLPSAEYAVDSASSGAQVLSVAKSAANSTGRTSWILVSQATNAFGDLPKAA